VTEPQPGRWRRLATRAKREGNGFVIRGRVWLVTSADGAAFAILKARTGNDPNDAPCYLPNSAS
jgi:alkylation response protein AidB-like acyl-CoA dehydrogenase